MARYTFALLCTVVLILLISSARGRSGGRSSSGRSSSSRGSSSGRSYSGSSGGSKYGSSGRSWGSSSGSKYGSSGSSWGSSSGSKYGSSSGSSWGSSSGTGLGSSSGSSWGSSSSNKGTNTHSSSGYGSLGSGIVFGSGSSYGGSHVTKPKPQSFDDLFKPITITRKPPTIHYTSSASRPVTTPVRKPGHSSGHDSASSGFKPYVPSAPPMETSGSASRPGITSNPHAPFAPPMEKETHKKTISLINHESGSSGAIQKVHQPGLNSQNPSNPPYPTASGAQYAGAQGSGHPPYPSAPGAVHPHAPSAPPIGFINPNSGNQQSQAKPGPAHIGWNVESSGGIQKVHQPGLNNQNPGPILPQYPGVQGSGHPQYPSAPGIGHPQYHGAPGVGHPQYHGTPGVGHPQYHGTPGVGHPQYAGAPGAVHPQYVQQPNVHYPTNQNVPYPRQPGGPIYAPQYHSQPQYYHPSPHLPPPPPGYSAYGVPIIYQSRDSTNDVLLGLTLWNMQRNNHHYHSHWDHDHHSDYHHHHHHYYSNPNEEEYHRENYERHTTYYTPKNPNPTTTGAHNTMQMTYYITPDDKGGFSTSMGNLTCMSVYNMKAVSRWANYTMRQFHKDYPNDIFPLFANLNGTEKVNFTITPGSIVHNETASITCCGTDKGHLDVTKIASGKYPDVNCVHYLGKIPFRKMIFTKIPPPSPAVNMSEWHQVTLVNMSSVDVNGSTPTPLAPFPTTTPSAVDMSQTFSSLGNANITTPLPPMSNGTESVDKNQTFTSLGANNSTSLDTNQTLGTNNTSTTVTPITVLTNNSEAVNLNETFASVGADRSTTTAVPLYPNELTVD